jgi:thiamine biosynthesis lipoprotein
VTTSPARSSFRALGTTVVMAVTDPAHLVEVERIVHRCVTELDQAASRFRPDSELAAVQAAGGRPVVVSDVLFEAVEQAVEAARVTGGLVDPTVGTVMEIIGYDRDFSEVAPTGPPVRATLAAVPGWRAVRLDPRRRTVSVPSGVRLDLGATAKAGCADRAAARAGASTGVGVLVSLGGDLAVAGEAPDGGWAIRVADRHDAGPDDPSVTVAVAGGGLATSGTGARRWQRGGRLVHHLVDPHTGRPADTCWRTVTVAAPTCLEANRASTAAVILGRAAPAWLTGLGLHARLVAEDGSVTGVGEWPEDRLTPASPDRLVRS